MAVKLSYGISIVQQLGTSPRPSPTRGGRYDGKTLISGGDDGKIELWDINTPTTRNLSPPLPYEGRENQELVLGREDTGS
jgi:WD40 repeat protein